MDVDATATYLEHRSLLFSIAYRMTGSVEDAEDITSEVFLRYRRALESGTAIETPRAFLATTATRLAIDHLRSAHHNRETYLGPWLPEPLVASTESDGATRVEVADSLSMAFLVVLESLTPVERAAFLLREVFQYDYADIAEIIGKSEANCRQLVRRANLRIADAQAAIRGLVGSSRPDRSHLLQRGRAWGPRAPRRRARRRRGGLRRRRRGRTFTPPVGARARSRDSPHAGAVDHGARRTVARRAVHGERTAWRDRSG